MNFKSEVLNFKNTTAPTGTRRKRCKKCDNLVYKEVLNEKNICMNCAPLNTF